MYRSCFDTIPFSSSCASKVRLFYLFLQLEMSGGQTFYLAVKQQNRGNCTEEVDSLYAGNKCFVGLRTTKEGAFVRAKQIFWGSITKDTLALLKIHFSYEGFHHYMTKTTGTTSYYNETLLSRQTLKCLEGEEVWHFNMHSLPMHVLGESGQIYVTYEFVG